MMVSSTVQHVREYNHKDSSAQDATSLGQHS